ncbi:hypothetical protein X768_23105 [Mesorhizobium sp. LSJC265A00]|nr:hypothetical protein X768_23105 [Mesorhizobium sp. LSJC265A00]
MVEIRFSLALPLSSPAGIITRAGLKESAKIGPTIRLSHALTLRQLIRRL